MIRKVMMMSTSMWAKMGICVLVMVWNAATGIRAAPLKGSSG